MDFGRALSYALTMLDRAELRLKEEQRQAIWHVYNGKDVFLWLPTGFGKSICYEVLPFMHDFQLRRSGTTPECKASLVLVISPLISLMADQVLSLRRRGVRSAVLTGAGSGVGQELVATDEDLSACSLLYCAPEALASSKWRDTLEMPGVSSRIVAIAVDEAHCVSKW